MTTPAAMTPPAARRERGDVTAWRPLLVVAAHPDDETIGAGGLLALSRSALVVHLTDGVPRDRRFWPAGLTGAPEAYARARREELARAMERAGLRDAVLAVLGARDQEAIDAVAALARRLVEILTAHRPAVLVTHPYEGGHPDHDAAALVSFAATELAARAGTPAPLLVEMTSYHARGDAFEAGRFLEPRGREVVRVLPRALRERKERMLAAYASQREVLARFQSDAERFRRAPRYDFSAPPHPGPLLYERWGFPITPAAWRARAVAALRDLAIPG